jgi:hypothetical protein
MKRKVQVRHPDSSLREGIRFRVQHGSPIPVVVESGKLLGLFSVQSVTARLFEVAGEQGRSVGPTSFSGAVGGGMWWGRGHQDTRRGAGD